MTIASLSGGCGSRSAFTSPLLASAVDRAHEAFDGAGTVRLDDALPEGCVDMVTLGRYGG